MRTLTGYHPDLWASGTPCSIKQCSNQTMALLKQMPLRSALSSALYLAATVTLAAQVRFSPDAIDIDVNGKPFTTYHAGKDVGKPFLAPLRSASGKIVTRHWPMENIEGESRIIRTIAASGFLMMT